jgi:hypothetical protein
MDMDCGASFFTLAGTIINRRKHPLVAAVRPWVMWVFVVVVHQFVVAFVAFEPNCNLRPMALLSCLTDPAAPHHIITVRMVRRYRLVVSVDETAAARGRPINRSIEGSQESHRHQSRPQTRPKNQRPAPNDEIGAR